MRPDHASDLREIEELLDDVDRALSAAIASESPSDEEVIAHLVAAYDALIRARGRVARAELPPWLALGEARLNVDRYRAAWVGSATAPREKACP